MRFFLRAQSGFQPLRFSVALLVAMSFVGISTAPVLAVGGVSGGISGSVVDTTTKAPITDATIVASSPSTTQTGHTDAHGAFAFPSLPTDTYTLRISSPGHETLSLQGVTVLGDQTINLDPQTLTRSLTVIGRTTGRSATSVFQPKQTLDAVTVSGQRAIVAAGKVASTDGQALALSVPGVQLTDTGRLTIRGGLAGDIGYQFDGVPATDPFLGQNQAANRVAGLGSLQIVEGAGDPTQGNVGTGTVNIVVRRGTLPPFGYIDAEVGAPAQNSQYSGEYGFATPNGRFSDYITYTQQRYMPAQNTVANVAENDANQFGISHIQNSDFINNAVFRFGRDNNQSLQFLVQARNLEEYGLAGGFTSPYYTQYQFDPYALGYGRGTGTGCAEAALAFCSPADPQPNFMPLVDLTHNSLCGSPAACAAADAEIQFFQNKIGLLPYSSPTYNGPTTVNPLVSNNPASTVKLEYDATLNATTSLEARMYNNVFRTGGTANYFSGSANPQFSYTGGNTTGYYLELDKTASDRHSLQFSVNYQLVHPIWDDYSPYDSYFLQAVGAGGLSLADFENPLNTRAPISAANPCPAGTGGCYLFSQLYPGGDPSGNGIGRVPSNGINFAGTIFREYGASIRDQWTPNTRLKLDLGLRFDGANFSQGCNQFALDPCGNPSDVPTNFLRGTVLKPHYYEPRTGIAYQFDPNDAVRFSYGRSIVYPVAQTFGTPQYNYGAQAFANVAPAPGTNTADPATWTCGSGFGSGPQYNAAHLFRCSNYGQQLYWTSDQNFDAPDVGNNEPEYDNNYDFSYSHQFHDGSSARLTTFYRRGYNVSAFSLISQVLDPTTGAPISQVFGIANVGIIKATGVELALSTRPKPVGLTGYASLTYTNELDSVPPLVGGEDSLALVSPSSLALGNIYRAGFLSPFTINAGASYKFASGFRINPILSFDRGYPTGVGLLTASGSPVGGTLIDGRYENIPATNLDSTSQPGAVDYRGSFGSFTAPQYVDPVFAGSYESPNIAATRGLPESSAAGGYLSRARANLNLDFEYQKSRNTFGVFFGNLIGSHYSEPTQNPFWQPVATGIGGPLTGTQASGNPAYRSGLPYLFGNRNVPAYAFSTSPLIEFPTNPTTVRVYYQRAL